ncbi:MAG: M28 family metallopeptidase [Oscillospiraceae bacterium]|nr:M28 family metallopeptidase [Oscillospiraceae bacterium]
MKTKGSIFAVVLASLAMAAAVAACGNNQVYGNGTTAQDGQYEAYEPHEMGYPLAQDAPAEEVAEILGLVPHGEIAMRHVAYMNNYLYGRIAFTYREKEAALWLVDTLLAMGYASEDIQMQEFAVEVVAGLWPQAWFDAGFQSRGYSQNVILTIPGQSERVIVVGAHYDSFPYPGANDNASGTALLLESAQRMLHLDNYHTIVYVFFGAEEVGLIGAQYYLAALSESERDNILFMVNADVLFEGPYLLYIYGFNESLRPDAHAIVSAWGDMAYALYGAHGVELIPFPDGINRWFSDHTVFYLADIPAVMLSGLDSCERWEFTPRWILHTPQDCFYYISEAWPGKMEWNIWGYSLFLEKMLTHRYEG